MSGNLVRSLLLLLSVAWAMGCHRQDRIAEAAEGLEAGTTTAIARLAHTPSAVVSQTRVAVGYTLTASQRVAWATSTNGTTWPTCNVSNATCNGGSVTPMVAGQLNWVGKGAMAAIGDGHVVNVVLGDSDGNTSTAEEVIALISSNDGQWFTASKLVNESGGDCDPATEDQPDVTVDQTTSPPTIWVVWRHNGSGTFGGCVRRGVISGSTISWLDKVRSVGGMVREDNGNLSMGQGGLRIVAGDGIVSIGYSDNDQLQTCPSTSMTPITWGTVSSFDNGADWAWTSKVFHTDHFLSCPFGTVQNGIRAFDFIRSPDGSYYFAVAGWDTSGVATMHLFTSEGSGVPIDTEVGSLDLTWREFCPGSQSTPDGGLITGGPAGNWTPMRYLCTNSPPPFATAPALMFPTLGYDGLNRVSLIYAQAASSTNFFAVYQGNITPRTAVGAFQTINPLSTSTWSPSGGVMLDHFALTPRFT